MERNNKDCIIKFRCTGVEKELIQDLAQIKGISTSEFIRTSLLHFINSPELWDIMIGEGHNNE